MGEIVMFDRAVNDAEQIIVNNYLSAKYGYTLSTNDIFNEDDLANGDYDHDVAGIGQASNGSNHTDSQGTGAIRINNPEGLGNDEFLIWGHNNGVFQALETVDVLGSVVARLDRVWRVSEVSSSGTPVDVGTIDMTWDLSGLGSVTASDLRLLIDTDNDGVFGDETPIAGAVSLGGDLYQFTGVPGGASGISDNRRFTLGTINNGQIPLPIELLWFEAKLNPVERNVDLNWATASEINNDYFTILRSDNAHAWEEISQIAGAGNSVSMIHYSAVDDNPLNGISYYQLKQTDFDGTISYSDIRTVNLNTTSDDAPFPNPTEGKISLFANLEKEIKVFNAVGQNVTNEIAINRNSEVTNLDLIGLPSGVYFVVVGNSTHKIMLK